MIQSIGISVGNANSYVAACQGGGIEILLNEYSNRSTPSMVAFTDQHRSIGVDALSNLFMNLKNTIHDLIVLIGKPYKQISLQDDQGRPNYSFRLEEASNGQALVVVRHLGEERKFTVTQVLAMLFTKLKEVANEATDCVISYPQFFDDSQKAALIEAALIAGLNPLQIISDMSAVILNYAYYRTTREDTHKFIAFINFGQSNLQSAIAWLNPKEDLVRILAAESESIGGRDFDKLLADYFVKEHKLNLNTKSFLKLVNACEKLKKNLSANSNETPIHVESLISEDKDFTARTDRAAFESLSQDILQKVEACLKRTLENAKANYDKLVAETIGAAEAAEIARAGEAAKAVDLAKKAEAAKAARAAKQAKATTEAAKVPEEQSKEAAKVNGEESNENNNSEAVKEEKKDDQEKPITKSDKETPMEAEPEELTKAIAEETRAIQAAKAAKASEKSIASQANKLRKLAEIKFDLQIVEMVGGSTRMPAIKQLVQNVFNLTPSTTLNTDEAVARGCVLHCATLHPGVKVKREVKILNSESFSKSTSRACDKELRKIELELITSDRKYKSRTESRNTLEEFIYSERSKLQQGDPVLDELNSMLDWVFSDEGEEASEEEYINKLEVLRKLRESKPVADHQKESQQQ